MQSRILETKNLTLDKAVEIASSMELSEQGTKQMQGEEVAEVIGASSKKPTAAYKDKSKKFVRANSGKSVAKQSGCGKTVTCFRCGRDHYASACTMDRNIKFYCAVNPVTLRKFVKHRARRIRIPQSKF